MRLVYYGTPEHAVPPLRRLAQGGHAPLLVVTRRDKPKGRGLTVSPSPVRAAAESLGIPVVTPDRASAAEEVERVRSLAPDFLVVVAYGQILSPALLAVPRVGALNLHFSLLPRHRGAAPVQAAILAGDEMTGVSTMWMTEGLDEGPILLERPEPIQLDDNAGTLGARLAVTGAELLAESLELSARGTAGRHEQDHTRATYAPKVKTADARLSLEGDALELARRVRAYAPEPGAWLDLEFERLVVLSATADQTPALTDASALATPPVGAVLSVDRARGIRVACGQGTLWLSSVRPAGRKEMSGSDYANGRRLRPGLVLPLRLETA
jgi:methionyl-tRNA formyltransferase